MTALEYSITQSLSRLEHISLMASSNRLSKYLISEEKLFSYLSSISDRSREVELPFSLTTVSKYFRLPIAATTFNWSEKKIFSVIFAPFSTVGYFTIDKSLSLFNIVANNREGDYIIISRAEETSRCTKLNFDLYCFIRPCLHRVPCTAETSDKCAKSFLANHICTFTKPDFYEIKIPSPSSARLVCDTSVNKTLLPTHSTIRIDPNCELQSNSLFLPKILKPPAFFARISEDKITIETPKDPKLSSLVIKNMTTMMEEDKEFKHEDIDNDKDYVKKISISGVILATLALVALPVLVVFIWRQISSATAPILIDSKEVELDDFTPNQTTGARDVDIFA